VRDIVPSLDVRMTFDNPSGLVCESMRMPGEERSQVDEVWVKVSREG
jgi:hypothetical protein